MVLLPILFVCFADNTCMFDHGAISSSIEECLNQNKVVAAKLHNEPSVSAFKTDCIDLTKPRKVESI